PVPHCGTNFWSRTYIVGQSTNLSVGLNVRHLYDANPVKVKFEVSGPGIVGTTNLGNGLLNNATRNCYCPWSVSLPMPYTFFEAGTYHFKMTADPDDVYAECDETNNILEVDVTVIDGADMRILSQFINPDQLNPGVGDSVSLIVSYENIGNSNVTDVMKLKVNVDEIPLDEVYPVYGLATGDHASIAIPRKWASSIPGAHVIRAIIDADNQVFETNESNNEATRAIIVGESANLYFQLFAASNTSPPLGDYININARIGNNGDVNATATVKFYYIDNSGDTTSLGQTSISVLAHDSIPILMPWIVADNSTTLIGKIVDVNVQEFNIYDNMATEVIGGFDVTLTSTPACPRVNNGTLTAHVSGGTAPYLYSWSNGASGQTLTGYSGDYTVTVTDNTGLNMVATGTIAEAPAPVPVLSGPASPCKNSTENLYYTNEGKSGYLWNVSAGGTITAGGTATDYFVKVTWNEVGMQHVSVNYTTANGCTAATATVYSVSVIPLPVATITGSDTAYVFSTGNIYTTQPGMSGYIWTLSPGGIITSRADTNSIAVTWSTVGVKTVSVTYTDGHGCSPQSPAVKNLIVYSLPVPTITGNATICGVPSPDNIYTTESGMNDYIWTVSSGGLITAGAGTNSITVEWIIPGAQYVTVTYTDVNGNSPLTPTIKGVDVEAIPVPTITGPHSICGVPSVTSIYTTEAGKSAYVWTVSAGGTISAGAGTNAISVIWTETGTQTVTVTYTTVNQCASANPAIFQVMVYPFIPATIEGPGSICGIPSVRNLYSTIPGMSGYLWSVSSGGTITSAADTNYIYVTWSTAGEKIVSLTYTDANGCSPANSITKNVMVRVLPVPVISGPATICGIPSTDNVYTTEAGMSGYIWHVSEGGSITDGLGTNAITVNWSSLGEHTVDVTYTDNHGCTPASPTVKHVAVSNNLPVYLTISASVNPACSGGTVTFTASAINGGPAPVYQWKVNGLNVGWNSSNYSYAPINNDSITCMVTSSMPCTTNSVAVSNSIVMVVYPHPEPPTRAIDQTVCSTELPAVLSVLAPPGCTVDWYNYAYGGSLLLSGNETYTTSTAGTYYAESRDLQTGCKSLSRVAVTLAIDPAILYFIDHDGDGYGNPEITLYACTQPQGYVDNGLDCDDNNANINPAAQHFAYTGNPGFTNSIVSPTIGSSYTLFHFEVDYFDATNSLPGAGYPRLILDYEGNGGFTDANDRVIIMSQADPMDVTTADGKRYFVEVNGLAYGTNWKARIVTGGGGNCTTTFGPFDCPDVLHEPNIYLFANDISFSVAHPTLSQSVTVSAVVHNESDFDAQNFVCHLVNQWDTLIVYPDVTVANLPAHQTRTVQWNIITPAVPAWCPMEVTVDYTNVIAENNELDNSAVRPFVNGNYQVAGKIVVQSDVSPHSSYANQYGYLVLSGRAWYTDLAVQLTDSTVAGATVEFTIAELGRTYTGYTNSWGYFSIYFPSTDSVGTYHITTSVTDFTLTGTDTTHFHILTPVIPQTKPNLTVSFCHSVDVLPVNPSQVANVSLVAHVTNNGNATANGPIEVRFTYSTGGTWVSQYNGNLEPGQSATVYVNAPVPSLGTQLTVYVDPNNTVAEWNESAGDNSTTDYMCYDFQPVGICGGNFWGTHCLNTTTGIYIGVNVSHLYDASQVDVKFEVSGPGISGWQNLGTGRLYNATRNCYCPYVVSLPDQFQFTELGTYTFRMTVDPDNVYPECDEANNVLIVTSNIVTCTVTPPVTKPNLAFTSCHSLDLSPYGPAIQGNATLKANIVNNGNATATGPINVDFTYSGGTFTGTFPGDMSPGQSAVVTVVAPLPAPATTILTAVIDPANAIEEWNESDNEASDNMCWEFQPVPHCGTNFWSRTYLVGQTTTLSVGLNVQHLYDANSVKVKFEVSGPGIIGTQDLGNAVLNNATRNCNCPWGVVLPMPFTFFQVGIYHFTMTADPDHEYVECNENNNVLEVDVQVIDGADMRILSQYINPDPLNPAVNDSVSFIVSYENIGNSNVNDQMKLKVILDNTTLDEVYPVSGLASGDHASVAIPKRWASSLPGAHVIRAIIDADNQVFEINESNNEATRALIVGESANLYFQLFAASSSNPSIGDYIHINSRIGNNGDVNATATVKFYYINNDGDTIPFGQSPIAVTAHDSTSIIMPWVVADNLTTIIGKIVDVNVQEFNPDDNVATTMIGGFTIAFNSTNACYKVSNGTLTAHVTGGQAPFLYLWNTGYIGQTLTAGAGNYTVTVTDNTGLSIIANGTIGSNPNVIPVISGPSTAIINSTGNKYTTQAGMTGYTWFVSGGLVTAGGTSAADSVVITWNTTGLQHVSVGYTDPHGCTSVTATEFDVMVYDIPNPVISGPDTVCANTQGNIYLTEDGMTAYSWTVSAGGTITGGGTSASNFVVVTWTTAGVGT
ncbi:MAG: CARDB domain-containing protein, partial [Bacteroidota bacterium]